MGGPGTPSSSFGSKDVDAGKYPSFRAHVYPLKASKINPFNLVSTERQSDDKEDKELPCLDKFLAKNTSEDNALFEHIMDLAKQKEKVKHSWLYEAEAEFKEVLLKGCPLSHSCWCASEYFSKETFAVFKTLKNNFSSFSAP